MKRTNQRPPPVNWVFLKITTFRHTKRATEHHRRRNLKLLPHSNCITEADVHILHCIRRMDFVIFHFSNYQKRKNRANWSTRRRLRCCNNQRANEQLHWASVWTRVEMNANRKSVYARSLSFCAEVKLTHSKQVNIEQTHDPRYTHRVYSSCMHVVAALIPFLSSHFHFSQTTARNILWNKISESCTVSELYLLGPPTAAIFAMAQAFVFRVFLYPGDGV